ncbi:MAG TPA: hypothetical protein VKZ63_15035, partial [Kofleriaceae bacterium]|nr:hypothetical protein [Kofleriaceae bacterium]
MTMRASLLVAISITLAACGGSSRGPDPAKAGILELDHAGEWTDPLADHPGPPAFAVGDRSAALANPRAPLIA